VTGDQGAPYCGGNCSATGMPKPANTPNAVKMAFPRARVFETYIQPRTAHVINLQYRVIQGWNGVVGDEGVICRGRLTGIAGLNLIKKLDQFFVNPIDRGSTVTTFL
jgi:hypothetical protein